MKNILIIIIIILACIAAYFYNGYKPVWQFDHLERNAKKVITGGELQNWATNLLAQYPTQTNLSLSQLGTNFPPRLRDLAPKIGPMIVVFEAVDTNSPRSEERRVGKEC